MGRDAKKMAGGLLFVCLSAIIGITVCCALTFFGDDDPDNGLDALVFVVVSVVVGAVAGGMIGSLLWLI